MPLPPRLFPVEDELGKKDDDHEVSERGNMSLPWRPRRLLRGQRRHTKRVILVIVVLCGLYYLFEIMPTDLQTPRSRPSYNSAAGQWTSASRSKETASTSRPNPKPKAPEEEREFKSPYYFSGPINFYELAVSLHAASRTYTSDLITRNVLFAAASLKSASILLPIACEMGIKQKNVVHFALMGRDDISMVLLRSINGVDPLCRIIFHDARPDYSTHSTDFRMEVSVAAAFGHINRFIRPQATLIDGSGEEEHFFSKALISRVKALDTTVIELPNGAEQNLMWVAWLDGPSLSAWNQVTVEMLVYAPVSSSGSLIRLLESLKNADFFSMTPPRLTIELPHKIDEPTRRYLENFKWPPQAALGAGIPLTLHHRIPQSILTPEENDIRFLESFWPASPSKTHILVLSPQTELSPLFYHYLAYTLLEYRYSKNSQAVYRNTLGISLELPNTYLNASSDFSPPEAIVSTVGSDSNSSATPFLWQAPSSNAALYFGDKWVELHDFVTNLLASQRAEPSSKATQAKLISKTHPSWLEHILKLARTRGYWIIYPGFEVGAAIATIHTDLYQPPEEYAENEGEQQDDATIRTVDPGRQDSLENENTPLSTRSLLSIMPFRGELPSIDQMPLLSWDGESIDFAILANYSTNYARAFRKEFGGCEDSSPAKLRDEMTAADLFCWDDRKS